MDRRRHDLHPHLFPAAGTGGKPRRKHSLLPQHSGRRHTAQWIGSRSLHCTPLKRNATENISGKIVLKEAESAKWLIRDELESIQWLPADESLIEKIGAALQFAWKDGE